jgi:hypothetical protein
MTRRKKAGGILRTTAPMLVVLASLMFLLAGCESIFGPKTEASTETSEEARIVCTNGYGQTLDIYMDGNLQFTLGTSSTGTSVNNTKKIHNVTLNEHTLQGKLAGTGTVVDEQTIDVTSYTDYTYTIGTPPSINISNKYGVTLKIYMDNVYQFDLANDESRWLMDVSKTEHYLKATKASDGKEVASTSITTDENKTYSWSIT